MARRNKRPHVAQEFGMEAKEDSSWTLPLTILGVTLLLSIGFFYYYFGPSIEDLKGDAPDPSASSVPIAMTIGETRMRVPSNFTRFPRARRDGQRDGVQLHALLPDLEPFTMSKAEIFDSNSPDSPVVYFDISIYSTALGESERLEQIYKDKVIDEKGREGPFGLTVYDFAPGTGYEAQDLFVFYAEDEDPIVLICDEETDIAPSPNCRRTLKIGDTLSLSYRYKRPWLAQWRSIDLSVQELVRSFIDAGG